jgi:hypothetical protein
MWPEEPAGASNSSMKGNAINFEHKHAMKFSLPVELVPLLKIQSSCAQKGLSLACACIQRGRAIEIEGTP